MLVVEIESTVASLIIPDCTHLSGVYPVSLPFIFFNEKELQGEFVDKIAWDEKYFVVIMK